MTEELKQAAQAAKPDLSGHDAFDVLSQGYPTHPADCRCTWCKGKPAAQATPESLHLFEFWWAAHMPQAPQTQAWSAWTAAQNSKDATIDVAQPAPPEPVGEPIGHVPGEWYEAKDRDDLEAFFRSRLPAIREAAHEHGYAIGLHGSMRRDLDLIAAPWREGASDKDVLAHAIAMAACGITRDGPYQWEQKPLGRVAASLPCCWPRWFSEAGAGHIDLSVVGLTHPAPGVPEGFVLVPVEPTREMNRAGFDAHRATGLTGEIWRAMLAAAQAKGGQA